jgi:DNA-binding beta-propeller fold protein YncE
MSELPLDPSMLAGAPEPTAAHDDRPVPKTVDLQPGEVMVVEVDPHAGLQLKLTLEGRRGIAVPDIDTQGAPEQAWSVTTSQTAAQRILGIAFPHPMTLSPDGTRGFVGSNNSALRYGVLTMFDTATNQVIRAVTLGDGVSGIAVSPDNSRVYVSRNVDGAPNFDIAILDIVSLDIIGTISLTGIGFSHLAISPDGSHLYACGYNQPDSGTPSGRLAVVDLARGRVIQAIVLKNGSTYIAINADGSRVYCSNTHDDPRGADGVISVVDTRTLAVVADINVYGHAYGVAVSPDGAYVYTLTDALMLAMIDVRTHTVIRYVPVGITGARYLAVSPDGQSVCFSNSNPTHGALIIDTNTFSLRSLSLTSNACTGVAFSPDGGHIYVADYQGNLVWVVDA